jgi:hypothetical protein
MKKYLILCCCLVGFLLSCSSSGEKVSVPEVVKTKFETLYPNAANTKWEMEDGSYEASFKQNNIESSVTFSADGNIIQSETVIDVAQLPQPVLDYLASQFGNQKIKEAEKITDDKGMVTFEAEIGETDYLFDANGQFIGKEEEEDKGEKE